MIKKKVLVKRERIFLLHSNVVVRDSSINLLRDRENATGRKGTINVCFDQRNHH